MTWQCPGKASEWRLSRCGPGLCCTVSDSQMKGKSSELFCQSKVRGKSQYSISHLMVVTLVNSYPTLNSTQPVLYGLGSFSVLSQHHMFTSFRVISYYTILYPFTHPPIDQPFCPPLFNKYLFHVSHGLGIVLSTEVIWLIHSPISSTRLRVL